MAGVAVPAQLDAALARAPTPSVVLHNGVSNTRHFLRPAVLLYCEG